jgi:hypothetical protein
VPRLGLLGRSAGAGAVCRSGGFWAPCAPLALCGTRALAGFRALCGAWAMMSSATEVWSRRSASGGFGNAPTAIASIGAPSAGKLAGRPP